MGVSPWLEDLVVLDVAARYKWSEPVAEKNHLSHSLGEKKEERKGREREKRKGKKEGDRAPEGPSRASLVT